MKKFSFVLNILLAAGIAYLLYKQKANPTEPDTTGCNQVCMNYTGSNYYTLNSRLLKTMADNFKHPNIVNGVINSGSNVVNSNLQIADISGNVSEDAHSVWFGLEDLKKFLWKIETTVCKSSCSSLTPDKLGVRIYYARYPDIKTYDSLNSFTSASLKLPPEYVAMHTVFMVPTFDNAANSNFHTDFYLDSSFQKCLPIPIITSPEGPAIKVAALIADPDGKNHGSLCPPLTNCRGSAY
jgi:hypothetical protein